MDQITIGDFPGETMEWLDSHGYRAAHVTVHNYSGFGVLYGRADDPMKLAVPGETLVWDGENVAVQAA